MDQLTALMNVHEFNKKFNEFIIHNCPCYKVEYANFADVCINNKSYLACIVVKKANISKILHLKLPIVFGSLIDYTIRGKNMDNPNQFGCLYLDGSVKMIYNFISNNLTSGHVWANKKSGEKIFKVNIDAKCHTLHMKYNPSIEPQLNIVIQNTKKEKKKKLEKSITYVENTMKRIKRYNDNDNDQPPRKRQKTKTQRTYEKLLKERDSLPNESEEDEEDITWIEIMNKKIKELLDLEDIEVNFQEDDFTTLFDAYLKHAPKLDDISNKVNRTLSYIMHRALVHNIESCYLSDKDLKNLNARLTNIFKTGNMYFTLAQYLNIESKLVKGFKSIYQNIEAQKLNMSATLTGTIKRSVNDSIKNSKALLFPADGFGFTCPIDSKEMKGAGENVMLSQLVIVPIGIDTKKVVDFLWRNKELLKGDCDGNILQCVINSFLVPFTVNKNQLLLLKKEFPTLSLMIFDTFLIISTNGYNQMKYSVKYKCFMNPHESTHIWPDAFEDYHPHLNYNSCSLFLPESTNLGLPPKLTVANANIRGRCMDINNVTELILFLHTNGASNAAIVHSYKKGDARALVSFDGMKHLKDYHIYIPINLKDPQMRYLDIAVLEKGQIIPPEVQIVHNNFKPLEDESQAYGLTLNDVVQNAQDSISNIERIFSNLYKTDSRYEFVNTKELSNIKKSDKPLFVNESGTEQVIYDNKMHHIKCYVRDNSNVQAEYEKCIKIDIHKKHHPHMYIYIGFGDIEGGTNEDGIIIDKKLVDQGPKNLISQTLNITYKDEFKKSNAIVTYTKSDNVIGENIVFGCLSSTTKLTFSKTKNTKINEVYVPPSTYYYYISVENMNNYKKYISSTFSSKQCSVNIHYSYLAPLGIGTKLSTGDGQKGVVCKIADLSCIKGYTNTGCVVHPLLLFSPTSVLGRTMASQIMSMLTQPGRAFTKTGVLIAPHGIHIHNINPSIRTKKSEVKIDLMALENGGLTSNLAYTMKALNSQDANNQYKFHFVKQLCALQGIVIKLLHFDKTILTQSL